MEGANSMHCRTFRRTARRVAISKVAEFLASRDFALERNVGCSGYRIDLAVRNPDNPAEFLLGIECDGSAYAAQKTTRDRDNLRTSVLHALGWHTYRAWSVNWAFDRRRAEENLLALIEKIRSTSPDPNPPIAPPPTEETPDATPVAETPSTVHPENRKDYPIWSTTDDLPQESFYEIATRDRIRAILAHNVAQCQFAAFFV